MVLDKMYSINFIIQILDCLFYYVSWICFTTFVKVLKWACKLCYLINEDRKLLSQYKLHANKHIHKLISLQLQVINSFKYIKMEISHKNKHLHYKFKVGEHVLF